MPDKFRSSILVSLRRGSASSAVVLLSSTGLVITITFTPACSLSDSNGNIFAVRRGVKNGLKIIICFLAVVVGSVTSQKEEVMLYL